MNKSHLLSELRTLQQLYPGEPGITRTIELVEAQPEVQETKKPGTISGLDGVLQAVDAFNFLFGPAEKETD